jgi:hypothetical protein
MRLKMRLPPLGKIRRLAISGKEQSLLQIISLLGEPARTKYKPHKSTRPVAPKRADSLNPMQKLQYCTRSKEPMAKSNIAGH